MASRLRFVGLMKLTRCSFGFDEVRLSNFFI